jgi:MoaA/NifB/PqqE/SkfB family radical SAM enzyme
MLAEIYGDFSARMHTASDNGPRLTNAQIELTYGCNLHCVHCYTDCYNRPELIRNELTLQELEHIFDQLRDLGVLWVALTGGEAFLRKDFREIYRAAKARGFIVSVLTNATTITESLADFLAEYPPLKLEISCHGASADTFDAITQVPGSFVQFCEGMRRLQTRNILFHLKTKAMTLNQHELTQLQAFVESFGVPFNVNTTIYPRLNGDLTPASYRLSPDEVVAIEGGVLDTDRCCDETPPVDPALAQPPTSDRLYRCGCGGWSAHINAWGELSACTWFKEPRISLRTSTVADAVTACFTTIRGTRYTSDSPCRTCHVHTWCDKMPAAAWAETPGGDVEQPVPDLCRVAYTRAAAYAGVTESVPT